jgi:hypothetical protein
MAQEREKGILDVSQVPSGILAHAPGYIDKANEIIVGLQTDAPLKRAIMPFGGGASSRRAWRRTATRRTRRSTRPRRDRALRTRAADSAARPPRLQDALRRSRRHRLRRLRQPAILAYSNKLAPTERPDIGYAMIFPGMTIVKILFVDIVPALMR